MLAIGVDHSHSFVGLAGCYIPTSSASVARLPGHVGFRCPGCDGEWRAHLLAPGPCPHCGWLKPKADWQPKVGDRVRGTKAVWAGMLGTLRPKACAPFHVEWDTGEKYGATSFDSPETAGLEPADQPAGLKAPEGVTLRYVSAEEYHRLHMYGMQPGRVGWSLMHMRTAYGGSGSTGAYSLRKIQEVLTDGAEPGETWLACPPVASPLHPKEKVK